MSAHLTVPFFPPDMFEDDRAEILSLVREVALDPSQRFILGWRVEALEQRLREATGAHHAIACGSGTGGLELSVAALGLGPGDEVVVPAFCCQPVASAVVAAGATPVFADVDERTLVLDPEEATAALSPATRAVMPAHVFSVTADMPRFTTFARQHGLALIEDAAVAQGRRSAACRPGAGAILACCLSSRSRRSARSARAG